MTLTDRHRFGPLTPILAAVVVALDQLSKDWALGRLGGGDVIHVVWTLQFNLAFNSGMAFGRARGLGPVIAVVATVVIVWLLVSFRKSSSRSSIVAVGLVIGGAAGNLVDRIFRGGEFLRGSVVDFIDFQWFPIFNVADVAINVGGAMLILGYVLEARRGTTSDMMGDAGDGDD